MRATTADGAFEFRILERHGKIMAQVYRNSSHYAEAAYETLFAEIVGHTRAIGPELPLTLGKSIAHDGDLHAFFGLAVLIEHVS